MSNRTGECKLCGGHAQLVESHIWPAFSYKRYASDLSKGGRFADMMRVNYSNSQYQEYWFCAQCDNELLGGMEKYAADFCAQLAEGAVNSYAYNNTLLPFVTSISWRVALFHIELDKLQLNVEEKAALGTWKDYLAGRKTGIQPYSQHAFVAFDQDQGLGRHRGIGGEVYPAAGLVYSRLGPLHMVGWLDRRILNPAEQAIWARSELSPTGGTITQIATQEVRDQMIAPSLLKLLDARWERTLEIIKEFAKSKGLL
jgi:hypothetical protein